MAVFDKMKLDPNANMSNLPFFDENIANFMRKGQMDDWKNHFTVAENEAFEKENGNTLADIVCRLGLEL